MMMSITAARSTIRAVRAIVPAATLLRRPQSHHTVRFYQELSYESHGPIVADVLQHRSWSDPTGPTAGGAAEVRNTNDSVKVEMLHVPWNPADMNAVQGVYPIDQSPELQSIRSSQYFGKSTTVAGSEGLGRVVSVPSNNSPTDDDLLSSSLQPGDYVTLGYPSLGTLRSTLYVPQHMLLKLDRGDELIQTLGEGGSAAASTIFQLGGTAVRMLRDFQTLDKGSVVLQNAGNSAVGYMVSQLAAAIRIPTVSLVRRGSRTDSELEALRQHLIDKGKNTLVIVEEDLKDKASILELKDQMRSMNLSEPTLALNAVGGASCGLLLKLLGPGGTVVTYGGMSRKPVTVSTTQLIFKDVQVRGYWQSRWMSQHDHATKSAMINELVDLVLSGDLHPPPIQVFSLRDYKEALKSDAHQSTQAIRSKIVFDCQA